MQLTPLVFDAEFYAKAIGGSVIVGILLLALYRNYNYIIKKSSPLMSAIQSGLTQFGSSVKHSYFRLPEQEPEVERKNNLNP